MGNLYFDESIRDKGQFIIGAAVYSDEDLSAAVVNAWQGLGLPTTHEYKSNALKAADESGKKQRSLLRGILQNARAGLVICPTSHRHELGKYAVALAVQLRKTELIPSGGHTLHLDQEIAIGPDDLQRAKDSGFAVKANQDSRVVAGIQVADYVAHSAGGMLLEQMGLLKKLVRVGENSGYDPDMQINLGFELWADLRYWFFQVRMPIVDESDSTAYYRYKMEGFGLYIAPSCPPALMQHSRDRFGENYLGCIH